MLHGDRNANEYLSKSTLWLMTVGAGLVVANNYYNQPLLGMIAKELGESESAVSKIAMFTQIGYALGLLFLVPLGDMFKRKKIILVDFVCMVVLLLTIAYCKTLTGILIASTLLGLASVIPQFFVPITAQLSKPEEKDKNVALVMSGLLVGILGSRVLSGIVGEHFGWRSVFIMAAVAIFLLGIFILFILPDIKPSFRGTYKQLVASIIYLAKTTPSLRLASIRGALGFGAFSVFWTTLVFRLEMAPYFQGSEMAGLMGIVGIVGALSASLTGYVSHKVKRNRLISITSGIVIFSWLVFGFYDYTYIGLVLGIVLLDMGFQSMHVTNQLIVFSNHPEATSRLNTVYMVTYFVGGALGTLCAGKAWETYQWTGVVTVGATFSILCLVSHLLLCKKMDPKSSEIY